MLSDSNSGEPVLPYHASLRDFLIDADRAKDYFLDPKIYHVIILVNCLQLIGLNHETQSGLPLEYAYHKWCNHLSSALSHQTTMSWMNIYGDIEMLMVKMEKHWLKTWMYGLNQRELSKACWNSEFVLQQIEASCVQTNSLEY